MISSTLSLLRSVEAVRGRPLRGSSWMLVFPSLKCFTHLRTLLAPISTLKSLVNFCSRDFLLNKEFDDSTLAKRHIVVGHFVRSDTGHVMQAIDVTRQSRITQQLVPSTTVLSFVCCSQFACKKLLLMAFGTTLVYLGCPEGKDKSAIIFFKNIY